MKNRKDPVPVGELLGPALRGLGMPSVRLGRRVEEAWRRVADPAWQGRIRLSGWTGGVLRVAVTSSALREELTLFHRERLVKVLRAALPDLTLVGIRFEPDDEARSGTEEA